MFKYSVELLGVNETFFVGKKSDGYEGMQGLLSLRPHLSIATSESPLMSELA